MMQVGKWRNSDGRSAACSRRVPVRGEVHEGRTRLRARSVVCCEEQRRKNEGREIVAEFSEEDVSGYRKEPRTTTRSGDGSGKAAAAEHGQAELWVFHSARLARGSGHKDEARALGEVFYDLKRHGVTLRSVQDDPYVTDEAFVGIASKMAHKLQRGSVCNAKAGLQRRAVGG